MVLIVHILCCQVKPWYWQIWRHCSCTAQGCRFIFVDEAYQLNGPGCHKNGRLVAIFLTGDIWTFWSFWSFFVGVGWTAAELQDKWWQGREWSLSFILILLTASTCPCPRFCSSTVGHQTPMKPPAMQATPQSKVIICTARKLFAGQVELVRLVWKPNWNCICQS